MNVSQSAYSNYPTGYNQAGLNQVGFNNTQPMVDPGAPSSSQRATPISNSTGSDQTGSNPTDSSSTASATQTPSDHKQTAQDSKETVNGKQLTAAEARIIEQLQQADSEVRRHEMAHVAAGGRYITSGASFSYQRGPDGKNYAVSGEVSIDTSAVPGDPKATMQKMQQIKNAALAPANPSSQDIKVASNATTAASKAMSELMVLQAEDQAQKNETQAFGNLENAAKTYQQVNELPENDPSTFKIAV